MIHRIRKRTKVLLGIFLIVPLLAFSAIHFSVPVQGATCTWSGGSGDWESAGNWTNCGGGVPGSADDVVIDADVTVTVNYSTTINNLILGNSGATTNPVLHFAYDAITDGALIIDDGNLTVHTGANITHSAASGNSIVGKVFIDIQSGSATIDGTINTDEKGYPGGGVDQSGYGPGGAAQGGVGNDCSGPGAGHGGKGGDSNCYTTGGAPYGSVSVPDSLGSGGNGGDDTAIGGDGGGVVKLIVDSSITISGTISVNGGNGTDDYTEDGGGGSGGSIWISADTITGSGTVSANGANGNNFGGGGAGGRIALYYDTDNFTGTLQVEPGNGQAYGGLGTIYKKDNSETYGDLVIDSSIASNGGAILCENDVCNGTNTPTFNDVLIDNYGTLTHLFNTNSQVNWLEFSADTLAINANGKIDVNAKGYSGVLSNSNGNGPGGGIAAGSNGWAASGAGYGGEGGDSQQQAGGMPYGSVSDPHDLGSGGAGVYDQNARGGNGGGYAKLTVNTTLTLNGMISANGGNGGTDPDGSVEDAGSGSGGSIRLDVNTITGSGTITSNGGTSQSPAGSGSGGRVAIYYQTNNFSGDIEVEPGNGYQYGGIGTIYKKASIETYGDLTIDSAISTNKGAILCEDDDCSGTNAPTYNNILIDNYGHLTHLENDSTQVNWLEFTADNLTINSNAKVNLNNKGYSGQLSNSDGNGPGGGQRAVDNGSSASGAGYGGDGGDSQHKLGGTAYGSIDTPHDLGSGGAGVWDQNAKGGNGGGYAKLTINETLTVNGSLSVNGQNGAADPDGGPEDAGSGSGGSLWLIVNTVTGNGTISSNGGTADVSGGAGAGGRIAIYYTSNTFSGTLQAEPGNGKEYGGLGTIFLKDSAETYGDLLIDSAINGNKGAILCDNDLCDGTVDVTYDDVLIDNYGILSHRENSTEKTYWLTFTANSLAIHNNAQINLDGRGYTGGAMQQNGNGPGGGRYPTNACAALGGGHGGASGNSNCYEGNTPSGTVDTPNELGSGGGGGQDETFAIGGDGGGMAQLVINETISINGIISANGENGVEEGDEDSGGGSGGSIFITADTIEGSGTVRANGGNSANSGGGASGGRIAFHYNTNSYTGSTEVAPGTGYRSGGTGTIFLKEQSHTYGDLHISNTLADKGTYLCENNVCDGTILHRFEDVFISNNGMLKHPTNAASQLYWLRIAATNITLSGNGKIDVSGLGYDGGGLNEAGEGPGGGGPGNLSDGCAGCGGGFGGEGGRSNCYDAGGSTYGTSEDVLYIGSGGNGGEDEPWTIGGDGGGLVELSISNTLTVDSGIYANGINSGTNDSEDGGAGSGGGISITTNVLAGSGTIEAKGGSTGTSGGGGGGGRIKLAYQTNNWSGNTLDPANAVPGGTGYDNGDNGTVQLNAVTQGYVINADAGIDVRLSSDWTTDIEDSGNQQIAYTGVGVENTSGNRIAEFTLFFDGNRDFSNVTAESSATKSLFHVTGGFSNIDGYDGLYDTYSLYVPKGSGNVVGICPGAANLSEINKNCAGLTYYNRNDANVEVVNISGTIYWKVDGLSSTGGFTILDGMFDEMSRLQINTASNHEIEFTTANGIDANTNTITVEFDPSSQAFDLSSITVSDIDLEDDGADKTLAASAGAGTWGVSINTSTDIITFTAPTDTAAGEIADDSVITIKIGTNADSGSNQIVNPSSAGQYEIEMRMNTADSEYGIVEVAIVDDDTVNITSYIDSFILFDIDTSETDEDCDAAGGSSPCDSHSGATDDSGYVVDLGEMSYLSVNASGDSVTHADGNAGNINYIYFDLSTNATGGATVTIISANGQLSGPGSNVIPSVTNDGDGVAISAGDGAYGIREVSNSTTSGTFTIAGDYDGGASIFGECTTTATQIFSTTSAPMDTGRLQMQVGASPDSSDGTGTYTDQLTFIVTSTF